MSKWTSREVTDMVGDGGSVRLDEELADWLDAEYDLDEDSEAWVIDALTGAEITHEDREVALAGYGIAVEFTD